MVKTFNPLGPRLVQAFHHQKTGEVRFFLPLPDQPIELDPDWWPMGPFALTRLPVSIPDPAVYEEPALETATASGPPRQGGSP